MPKASAVGLKLKLYGKLSACHPSCFSSLFLPFPLRASRYNPAYEMSSPEELAREKIDALLTQCGWILQNRSTINLSASRGVAIREAL